MKIARLTPEGQTAVRAMIRAATGISWSSYQDAYQSLEDSFCEQISNGEKHPRGYYEIGQFHTISKRPEIINASESMFTIETIED